MEDIQNATQIFAVVTDGSFIDCRELDGLLGAAKQHRASEAKN